MDCQHTPEIWLAIIQAELDRAEQRQRHKRIDDVASLREDELSTVEDIVLLRAIEDLMRRVWHKGEDWRKANMHLTKLGHDLRKDLREALKK